MENSPSFDFDAYASHAGVIAARFEERRSRFLHQLNFRLIIALILFITFPWWFGLMARWDHAGATALPSLGWLTIHFMAGAVILAVIIAYTAMPLLRYRHYRAQIGSAQQDITLKGGIFTQLFKYFGDFIFYDDRKLALRSFHNAPTMPDFDEYISEDYIKGALAGVSVEITEVQLKAHRQGTDTVLFNGLMIVLDINDSNLVLHGKFSGKTVVIANRPREDDYVIAKYADYRRAVLPDTSFEQHFEAFTTDPDEASRLLTSDLLRNLLKLSATIGSARNQALSPDNRLAYMLGRLAGKFSNRLAAGAEILLHWFKTGSFRVQSTRPEMQLNGSALPADAKRLSRCLHCAFYEDKVLITIPYRHNLFEPDSIFQPPLHADDIKLTYELMTAVNGMAGAVLKTLPKSAF
jgi:hypothetical protein